MDENEKNTRPNAAYNITDKKQIDDELVFRYSREERLAKAPTAVRNLYDNSKKPKFSLFGPLVGGKGRTALFASIFLIFGALLMVSVLNPLGKYSLDGNSIEIQAIKFDGAVIVIIKKTIKSSIKSAYTGTVDIGVSEEIKDPPDEEKENLPLFLHRIFFTAEKSEEYRFSIPFEAEYILMVLQTEKNTLSLKLKVD